MWYNISLEADWVDWRPRGMPGTWLSIARPQGGGFSEQFHWGTQLVVLGLSHWGTIPVPNPGLSVQAQEEVSNSSLP